MINFFNHKKMIISNRPSFKTIILLIFLIFITMNASGVTGKNRSSMWIDLYRGEPLHFESLIDDIKNVQIVYLGETHSIKRHHELQEAIVKALINNGKIIYLGLEQMEAYYQKELDRFNNCKITFKELAIITDWQERWGNYGAYEPIIRLVHKNNGKIIALNARAEIIKKIGRKGLKGLSQNEKKEMPDRMVLSDKEQERLLNIILKVHATMNPEKLRPVIDAQMSRDEKMADIISQHLKNLTDKKYIFIALGGAMHFSYRLGVPKRVAREIPSVKDRIILFSDSGDLELSYHEKAMAREITITHEDLRFLKSPIADYINVIELKK